MPTLTVFPVLVIYYTEQSTLLLSLINLAVTFVLKEHLELKYRSDLNNEDKYLLSKRLNRKNNHKQVSDLTDADFPKTREKFSKTNK